MGDKISLDDLLERCEKGERAFQNLEVFDPTQRKIDFSNLVFDRVVFDGVELRGASFISATLNNCSFRRAVLIGADFSDSSARGVDFSGAKLGGTVFDRVDLTDATFRSVTVDDETNFKNAVLENCVMSRYTLESLKDYGGLTTGARMSMDIEDGVAELRANYSGFWQVIHLLALVLFVTPYLFFLGREYAEAHFTCKVAAGCVTLSRAFWQYIYTGGEFGDTVAWIPFGIFWFSLAYNLLRLLLLWKTKSLELEQDSKGLPANFDLVDGWRLALTCAHVGFVINVLLVLVHTWHFLQVMVPAR
jgi:uncharacterized protein YjbI with pentapeptide repeats